MVVPELFEIIADPVRRPADWGVKATSNVQLFPVLKFAPVLQVPVPAFVKSRLRIPQLMLFALLSKVNVSEIGELVLPTASVPKSTTPVSSFTNE
jgi:hypothetical protein